MHRRRFLLLGLLALGCKRDKPVVILDLPTQAQRAVPTKDLVRVGTIGDAPQRPVEVGLTADGRIVTGAGEMDLDQLYEHVARRARDARPEPDGSSTRNVVLRVHPSLPFEVVQWAIRACAEARTYRIHFAVRPEDGEEEGAMAVFLPKDRGLTAVPTVPPLRMSLTVRLVPQDEVVDDGLQYAAYREAVAQAPDLVARVDAEAGVKAGHVIRTVDLLLRAGVRRVELVGAPAPQKRAAGGPWLQEYVASHPAREGFKLASLGEGTRIAAPPPVARVRGRVAGSAPEDADRVLEVIEEPEIPIEEPEVPMEEQIEIPGTEEEDSPFEALSPNSAIGLGGGSGGSRRRAKARSEFGGMTEDAVELGLQWLAKHQDLEEDGKWDCDGFMKHDPKGDKCDGAGQALHDVGVTGLALLAFLGAGYTDRGSEAENKYAKNVRAGLRYLRQCQAGDGVFGTRATHSFMYSHAIATLAMCEAYWMTRNSTYRKPAQDGLNFIALARNPYMAWRYDPRGGENDTSITAWCVMALKSGKMAGLEVDPDAFVGASLWIEKMTNPDTGAVGYNYTGGASARPEALQDRFPAGETEAMTAAGVLCRVFLGEDPRASDLIQRGANRCAALPPRWNTDEGSIDMYYWYYGSLALYQVGGNAWKVWNERMKEAIVGHQHGKNAGSRAGSWDPIDAWGEDGGRVYATAMLVLCLEVYYRYDRVFGVK